MKKTTAYARKMRRGCAGIKDIGAVHDTIAACRPYTSEIVPGSWIVDSGTQSAATSAMLHVRECFESLKSGVSPDDSSRDYDYLTHALGVSVIRSRDIFGGESELLPVLLTANAAMQRCATVWVSSGHWCFDDAAIADVGAALDVYEAIMQASSPMQMQDAMRQRIKLLDRMRKNK